MSARKLADAMIEHVDVAGILDAGGALGLLDDLEKLERAGWRFEPPPEPSE